MKRKILILLMILGVGYVFLEKGERKPAASQAPHVNEEIKEEIKQVSAAPEATWAKGMDKEIRAEEKSNGSAGDALPALAPLQIFPGAKEISREESGADAEGKVHVIKTLETSTKHKFVRVEETYIDGEISEANLVEQNAMVANQLLAQKPAAMAEERFLQILQSTGATEVKKVGDGFLVTFLAEPQNPLALEGFLSKVRGSAQGLVVEPNYLRRLF